jgi:hypothetical protein
VLPHPFWIGDNQHSDPRRLGRFSDPGGGGTFHQLGASGGYADDLWIRLPSSPTPALLSGWSTVGSLAWNSIGDRLSVVAQPPLLDALIGPASGPDFLSDWSATAAGIGGMQQHPLYRHQLGSSGGTGRPTAGVLWPRRI